MARTTTDAAALDGTLKRCDLRLDLGTVAFFRALGEGNMAAGARRAARLLSAHYHEAGTLPRAVLERMERTHPERAAAYYENHPGQMLSPYIPPWAGSRTPTQRDDRQTLREIRHVNERGQPAAGAEPDPFAGWND